MLGMPFAPMVALEFSTPAPKAPPAIVATITQADGETAVKSASLTFPPQFDFNERFRPQRCQPAEEKAQACPPASKVGTVSAESSLATADADVFLTQDFRVVAFVDAAGFRITFTGLPNLALRRAVFGFEAGEKALIKNPAACGRYTLPLHFVSYEAEQADASPAVDITGCPPALTLTGAKVAGTRPVRLNWRVGAAVHATRVRVQRDTGANGFATVTSQRTAATSITFKHLRPGRYRARLQPVAGGRAGRARTVSFRVR